MHAARRGTSANSNEGLSCDEEGSMDQLRTVFWVYRIIRISSPWRKCCGWHSQSCDKRWYYNDPSRFVKPWKKAESSMSACPLTFPRTWEVWRVWEIRLSWSWFVEPSKIADSSLTHELKEEVSCHYPRLGKLNLIGESPIFVSEPSREQDSWEVWSEKDFEESEDQSKDPSQV